VHTLARSRERIGWQGIWRAGIALGAFLPALATACSGGLCGHADGESQGLSVRPELRLDFRSGYIDQNSLRLGTASAGSSAFSNPLEQGTATRRSGGFNEDWDWFGQALYQMAVAAKENYRSGNSFNFNLGSRHFHIPPVSPQIQADTSQRARDGGANGDPVGKLIYLSPGITVTMDRSWKIFSFVQIPLYQQVDGLQLAPRWLFSLGTNYRF